MNERTTIRLPEDLLGGANPNLAKEERTFASLSAGISDHPKPLASVIRVDANRRVWQPENFRAFAFYDT